MMFDLATKYMYWASTESQHVFQTHVASLRGNCSGKLKTMDYKGTLSGLAGIKEHVEPREGESSWIPEGKASGTQSRTLLAAEFDLSIFISQ